MESWLTEIASRPEITLGSALVGVLGFMSAIYFYLNQKKEKIPMFRRMGENIVQDLSGTFQSISVLYEGNPIPNLTVTKIFFWNNGKETILREDIAEKEPLIVEAKDGTTILDVRIVYSSRNATNCTVATEEPGKKYSLWFDFLDYRDNIVLQIMHTGVSVGDVNLSGTIRGALRVIHYKPSQIRETLTDVLIYVIPFTGMYIAYSVWPSQWALLVGVTIGALIDFSGAMYFRNRRDKLFPRGSKPIIT
jgi:hypothetical protein